MDAKGLGRTNRYSATEFPVCAERDTVFSVDFQYREALRIAKTLWKSCKARTRVLVRASATSKMFFERSGAQDAVRYSG